MHDSGEQTFHIVNFNLYYIKIITFNYNKI